MSIKQNTGNNSKQLQWSIQNVTIGVVPPSSRTCPASILIQANIYDDTLVLHKIYPNNWNAQGTHKADPRKWHGRKNILFSTSHFHVSDFTLLVSAPHFTSFCILIPPSTSPGPWESVNKIPESKARVSICLTLHNNGAL